MKKQLLSLSLALALASTTFISSPASANTATAPVQAPITTLSTYATDYANSYEMIRSALVNNETFGQFDPTEISSKEIGTLIRQIVQENPDILYYKSASVWASGKIQFNYYLPADVMKKNRAALDAKVEQVLKSINKPKASDYDKVKAVHDYLVLNTSYDHVNQQKKTIPADSYTAHGALIGGTAVCDGYTKAAQLLLNRLGVENHYVVGNIKDGLHSWNQVKINGKYYFMDITWDDPVPNKPGQIEYNYFLVTSEQLRKDHSWVEKSWPVATDKQYSYFADFKNPIENGNFFYYSSKADNHKLYRISKDGKNKQRVNNVRAPYFSIAGNSIYFSNYSSGGHLYKMNLDGTKPVKLNSIHSINLSLNGNVLHFTNNATKAAMKMTIK
ncbi:DUF5050 domain-containing protein [Sporosarcina sp. FSL K6-1522]|uniref:DUF5050 domain-containing protein n=1 Tax=Sporosarcina sp. FSL K6-1522 TaxID=2921554 RepID=UPI00315A11E5